MAISGGTFFADSLRTLKEGGVKQNNLTGECEKNHKVSGKACLKIFKKRGKNLPLTIMQDTTYKAPAINNNAEQNTNFT